MTHPRKDHAHGLNLAVARALTEARKNAGLTNENLAAALNGTSLTSVQRYLSGRAAINVEVLSEICSIIGVSEVEIVERADRRLRQVEQYDADEKAGQGRVIALERPTLDDLSEADDTIPTTKVAKRSQEAAGASEFED